MTKVHSLEVIETMPELRSVRMVVKSYSGSSEKLMKARFPAPLSPVHERSKSAPLLELKNHRPTPCSQHRSKKATAPTGRLGIMRLMELPSHRDQRRNALATSLPLKDAVEKINTFMRLQSIACEVNREDSSIRCWTPGDEVHFVVHLWRRPGVGPANRDAPVIAKLERQRGCGIMTQHLRRSLYKVLMNSQTELPVSLPTTRLPRGKPCPKSITAEHSASPSTSCSSEEAIARCLDMMMKGSCQEERRLGLEGLELLSLRSVSGRETAQNIARSILRGGEGNNGLRQQLVLYLHDCQTNHRQSLEAIGVDYRQDDDSAIMHNLALRVLANALAEAAAEDDEQVLLECCDSSGVALQADDLQQQFWHCVLGALVCNIKDAVFRPHSAAISASCLVLAEELRLGPVMKLLTNDEQQQQENALLAHVLAAHNHGHARHLGLELESQRLITLLS